MRREDGQVVATARGLQDAVDQLRRLCQPLLNWAGKAERLSFEVPTLPLFVHERLSTKAIVETLKGHRKPQERQLELFGDPHRPVIDQVLKAYEYRDQWVNRLILGDSLVVMNSLLHYEGLAGQVQMIYMDPPYGVKFGSNFQPFVRKPEVSHNEDDHMTREPEMVKAYRDTWELGLHSYLTYLKDRLHLCRELLTSSGSIFLQISDENLHHVREVMDEVFGSTNFKSLIAFKKTGGQTDQELATICDYLLHYSKDHTRTKYNQLYQFKVPGGLGGEKYTLLDSPDGTSYRQMTKDEIANPSLILDGWKPFRKGPLNSQHYSPTRTVPFKFRGKIYHPGKNRQWTVDPETDLPKLAELGYIIEEGTTLAYKLYLKDNPLLTVNNLWTDTAFGTLVSEQLYVVQTAQKVIQRCILMTTEPGDLVLDSTCGGGTTAYIAEQWGRRWITADVSRVPMALARQRMLTATFPYYELKDEKRGPASGFVYNRKLNKKGEEVGGIVPHITLKAIANNGPPEEEVLVDRPEVIKNITRVTGPFCVEATIPSPVDWEDEEAGDDSVGREDASFMDRMLEVLRQSPVIHLGGGKTVTLKNIRPPAKTLSLSAEAVVTPAAHPGASGGGGEDPDMVVAHKSPLLEAGKAVKLVALVFGPENGAVSEKLVPCNI